MPELCNVAGNAANNTSGELGINVNKDIHQGSQASKLDNSNSISQVYHENRTRLYACLQPVESLQLREMSRPELQPGNC